MFDFIKNLFSSNGESSIVGRLTNRLVNRFTAGGAVLIVTQLVHLKILPKGSVAAVDGLSNSQLVPWLIIAVGIWLVFDKGNVIAKGVTNLIDKLHTTELEAKQQTHKLKKLDEEISNSYLTICKNNLEIAKTNEELKNYKSKKR